MPMGMADIATVLFSEFLRFDAEDPHWLDRDRFLISNGHGSMLLYSLLYLAGYKDMPIEEIERFRQIDSKTPGHPEYRHADGIETTTGPLGQGIANSVGMALAERIMNASFGNAVMMGIPVIVAAFGFVFWFSGGDKPSNRKVFRGVFSSSVSGLSRGAQVLFNGLRVGEVTKIDLADNPSFVYALVELDPRTPVKTDTRARLEYQGLTGVASVALTGGSTKLK
jgi:hypothetical protein